MPEQQAAISSVLCTAGGKIREIMKTITPPRSGGQSPVMTVCLRHANSRNNYPRASIQTWLSIKLSKTLLIIFANMKALRNPKSDYIDWDFKSTFFMVTESLWANTVILPHSPGSQRLVTLSIVTAP